jgi:L-ascorbate metabolism protein UlaG (beta-lactamase superfamily)
MGTGAGLLFGKMDMKKIVIKWFPPSWVQIKFDRMVSYIDPAFLRTNFVNYPKTIEFTRWPDPTDGLPEKMEIADYIFITHHHKDHCKDVTIKRLANENTTIFAPKDCVKKIPFSVTVVKSGDTIQLKELKVKVVPAYNLPKNQGHKTNHPKGKGVGYIITINNKSIYHAGDSDVIPEMKQIKNIELAFLPIGNKKYTMDKDEAVFAAAMIKPKIIVPIHRYAENPHEFKQQVEKNKTSTVLPVETGEAIMI